jgi:hypothetical protein
MADYKLRIYPGGTGQGSSEVSVNSNAGLNAAKNIARTQHGVSRADYMGSPPRPSTVIPAPSTPAPSTSDAWANARSRSSSSSSDDFFKKSPPVAYNYGNQGVSNDDEDWQAARQSFAEGRIDPLLWYRLLSVPLTIGVVGGSALAMGALFFWLREAHMLPTHIPDPVWHSAPIPFAGTAGAWPLPTAGIVFVLAICLMTSFFALKVYWRLLVALPKALWAAVGFGFYGLLGGGMTSFYTPNGMIVLAVGLAVGCGGAVIMWRRVREEVFEVGG